MIKDQKDSQSVAHLTFSKGVVLDYGDAGNITGIDIDNASHKINLNVIILNKVPPQLQAITA